jgi:hypothetical protein
MAIYVQEMIVTNDFFLYKTKTKKNKTKNERSHLIVTYKLNVNTTFEFILYVYNYFDIFILFANNAAMFQSIDMIRWENMMNLSKPF